MIMRISITEPQPGVLMVTCKCKGRTTKLGAALAEELTLAINVAAANFTASHGGKTLADAYRLVSRDVTKPNN